MCNKEQFRVFFTVARNAYVLYEDGSLYNNHHKPMALSNIGWIVKNKFSEEELGYETPVSFIKRNLYEAARKSKNNQEFAKHLSEQLLFNFTAKELFYHQRKYKRR